jgi:hypothetical protein
MINFVIHRRLGWLAVAVLMAPHSADPARILISDPARLVEYLVTEKVRSVTPHGPTSSALLGTIAVSGERARWELTAGTFPHSSASIALADRGTVTLLDPLEKISAVTSVAEFDSLLRGISSGESGGTNSSIRDVELSVKPDGVGRLFQGAPTRRFSIDLRWVLAVQSPGRFANVRSAMKGIIETAPEFEDAHSPFDDLARLLPLRGEALDALTPELHRVSGFPVFVSLEMTSEMQSEPVGPNVAEGMRQTPRTTTTVTRSVSRLQRRKREPTDGTRFEVPAEFRLRGLERLRRSVPALP